MDIIHKVFVTSTYQDLREERAAVERTLLQLQCFPVGMEIFPAADDPAWEFIKRQIDGSSHDASLNVRRRPDICRPLLKVRQPRQ